MYGTTSCIPDSQTFSEDLGKPLYYNILDKQHLFNHHWDTLAMVPYLLGKPTGSAAGTFVSYDNVESISKKASQIAANQMRGVIIWEITGDYLETSAGSGVIASTPLVDTINKLFCHSINIPEPSDSGRETSLGVSIYPVPASTGTTILIRSAMPGPSTLTITDMNGRLIDQKEIHKQSSSYSLPITLEHYISGMYLVTVTTLHDRAHAKLIVRH